MAESKGFTKGFSAKADCGCEVLIFPTSGYSFQWCSKHKAAPKLYEALKALYAITPDSPLMQLAREALAEAEGK